MYVHLRTSRDPLSIIKGVLSLDWCTGFIGCKAAEVGIFILILMGLGQPSLLSQVCAPPPSCFLKFVLPFNNVWVHPWF